MKRVALLGGLVAAGIVSVGGCTQILGDFTVGGDAGTGGDTSIEASPDVQADTPALDTGNDQNPPPPDTGPKCGAVNDICCAQAPACGGSAACCSGKCLDVSKDPLNCGACGKDCRGGTCTGGKCDPVQLGGVADKDPTGLVVGPARAYFSVFSSGNNGKLYDCDLIGGCQNGPTMRIGGIAFAGNIVQDQSSVFLADFNGSFIYFYDKVGLSYTKQSLTNPYGLDFDGARLLAATNSTAYQMTTTGGVLANQVALSGQEGVIDIAGDGQQYVYWSKGAPYEIRTGKYGFIAVNTFRTAAGEVGPVAASKTDVAWSETNTSNGNAIIYACPGSVSCANPIVLGQGYKIGIRLDIIAIAGTDVYWTAADFGSTKGVQVYKCAVSGCNGTPKLLAEVPTVGLPVPGQVTRDQTFVYFLVADDNGTRLFRIVDP